jgi:hypothetical protein
MRKELPIAFLFFIIGLASAYSQSGTEEHAEARKDPAHVGSPKRKLITLGWEERIRSENWNNVTDFNDVAADPRRQVRFRTRIWMNLFLGSHVEFCAGLNNEFKKQTTPGLKLDPDEVLFENLFLDFKNIAVPGLSFRIGRQNLSKGEGALIFESTPLDGSRTVYSNLAGLTYSFRKSSFEFIGVLNPARDRFLPTINDKNKPLLEWDEQAVGFYYTDKNHSRTQFENYYLYKKEVHDSRAPTHPQFQPDRHLHTAGGRVVQKLEKGFSLTGECAGQWGRQHPGRDIRGWGGYGYLKKTWDLKWKPTMQFGYWGFSGDDPSTPAIEAWDPLFSRWPKWSELYIFSLNREKGASYWSNTRMLQVEAGLSPRSFLDVRLTYYHMNAFHPFLGDPQVFGTGTDRGDMFQGRIDFRLNKKMRGHVLYEHQIPGNYYRVGDDAYFLRFEMNYSLGKEIFAGPKTL